MGRFVCEPCRSAHGLRVWDLVLVACCEACGVLRDDWSPRNVSPTRNGGPFSYERVLRRAKVLRQIADLDAVLRGRR